MQDGLINMSSPSTELAEVFNKYGVDDATGIPDFLLAEDMGLYEDTAVLEHTDTVIRCHHPSQCEGHICSLHNRTDHSMRSFPQHWRWDRGIMERVCPHGVGHPDPDDYMILNGDDNGIHGCCGCCSK